MNTMRPRGAVVTGASSGIGLATAQRLARSGYRVVLAARNIERCEAAATRLRGDGAQAYALPLDLRDRMSIARLAVAAAELLGGVDVLVSNAGVSRPWLATSENSDVLRDILETNFVGTQQLVSRCVPMMRERGRGDLVFVSSHVVGGVPRTRMSAYAASKHALEGWISVLQNELEGTGIRASVVRPGPTVTNHAADWNADEMRAMFEEWNRKGATTHWGLLQSEDVADAVSTVVGAPEHVHLRLIEVVPSAPRVTEPSPARAETASVASDSDENRTR